MKAAQLEERLSARHLQEPEDTEVLKEAAEAVLQPIEKGPEEKADPRDAKVWTFNFVWTDGRRKTHEGVFTNRILTIGQQQQVAILEAKLCGGMPFESIDQATRSINHAIAHMTYSLTSTPPWARDLRKVEDPMLVIAIYQEVASHEARFFGFDEA
jgi:hypothetical protein